MKVWQTISQIDEAHDTASMLPLFALMVRRLAIHRRQCRAYLASPQSLSLLFFLSAPLSM